jgi:RHS repeat-associated protein
MLIIGCDFHTRYQQIAMVDEATGTALQWNSATQCATTATAGTILDMKYNFNLGAGDNGNVIGITNNRDTTRSQAFVYDSLNRIQTAGTVNTSGTNCWGETYGIDAWANLSSLALPSSYSSSCSHETPFSYAIPNSNQLPSASGFTYDAAGNLMATGLGNYVYNAEHQMTSVTVASTTTTYSYDGDGKRVEKSGGKIYWYGGGPEALDETDLSGNTNNSTFSEYVSFTGKKVARRDYQNNVYYYFADHLGTSREMVQAGQTSPCYDADFYPYGGENAHTTTCTQNYKFTAKERDAESGLDNFGARYMASSFGRFLSPDWSAKPSAVPFSRAVDPQSLNLYSYVRNSPMRGTDPDGHCPWCDGISVATWFGQRVGVDGGVKPALKNIGIGAAKGTGTFVYNTVKMASAAGSPGAAIAAALTPPPAALQPSNQTQAQASAVTQITLTAATAVIPLLGEETSATTALGDTFTHYGFLADADSFSGGLRPGSFATTMSDLTGSEAQSGLALPARANLPDAAYTVTPDPGTSIIGPSPAAPANGQPGGLPEVQFPQGTGPGTVAPPRPIPPD